MRWSTRSACATSTCRSRRRRSGARGKLPERGLLGRFYAVGNVDPRVLGARPAVPLGLDPAPVVEAARRHAAAFGHHLERPGERVAASRAELHAQPAAAFVGAVLVGLELALQELEVFLLHVDADAERAAGAALAEGAVAHADADRRAGHAIAHRAAKAAAVVDAHRRSMTTFSRLARRRAPGRRGACRFPAARARARCRPTRWSRATRRL